jgi:hypothetical protein
VFGGFTAGLPVAELAIAVGARLADGAFVFAALALVAGVGT